MRHKCKENNKLFIYKKERISLMRRSKVKPKSKTTKSKILTINSLPPKLKSQIFFPSFFTFSLKFGAKKFKRLQIRAKPIEPRNKTKPLNI